MELHEDKLRRIIAGIALENKSGHEALDLVGKIADELFSLRDRVEMLTISRDAARREHDSLENAVMNLDEHHPLIAEMLHSIRQEEWADMRADGLLTPNEMVDELVDKLPLTRKNAAGFVQWLTGDREMPGEMLSLLVQVIDQMNEVTDHERD